MSKSKKPVDRVQEYSTSNIPKRPRLTRSSKNNKRAIDTLDKQLDQLLKNQKDGKYSPNIQPIFMGSSFSPMGSYNIGHQIILNDNETSPTPKRRKTKNNETYTRNKIIKLPLLPRSKNPDSSINSSREYNMDSRLINSSPIQRKNVKFADKLEASERNNCDVRSSPIQRRPQLPIKSILRRTNYIMNDSPPKRQKTLFAAKLEDNSTADRNQGLTKFWSAGDIHEISDSDNFDEYKNIIMNGLKYLENEHCDRKYEIYATFAKLISVATIKNVANKTEEKIEPPIDRESIFIIENLDRLMPIIMRDMQGVIKNNGEIVVPDSIYLSRIYHQLVKLITLFFSNNHIVAALIKNENYIKIVHSIFQDTYEIFGNIKTTKQILTENLTFLKKEQISVKIFSFKQKSQLIGILSNMKEFQSLGVIKEKLSLIKALLIKYPNEMLDQINGWLPREILLRILMCTSSATQEILNMTIAILCDVFERRTDNFLSSDTFFSCVEVDLPTFTIPKDIVEKLIKLDITKSENKPQTWGSLIRLHAKYLLKQGQFGSAYNLGTSMVKLLYYQKCSSVGLLRFSETQFNEWLDLNKIFFREANDTNALELSIKMWEIVVLILWNSTFTLHYSKPLMESMASIIEIPFKMVFLSNKLDHALPVIESLLLKLYFLLSKESYSKGRLPTAIFNRWFNIIKQICLLCFRSGNPSMRVFVTKLIYRTVDIECILPNGHLQGHESLTDFVVFPDISMHDIPCISLSFYRQRYRLTMQLFKECICEVTNLGTSKIDCDIPSQLAPLRYFGIPLLMELSQVVLKAYIGMPRNLTLNDLDDILSYLTLLFADALFYDFSADYMINYLLQIKSSLPIQEGQTLFSTLFKTLFKMYTKKGRQYIIIYAFRYIDLPVVSKSVCEYIDQIALIDEGDPATLYMMIKVLSLCHRDFYFEKMLAQIFNGEYVLSYKSYNILNLLHMEEWDSPHVKYFVESCCRMNKSKFSYELFSMINKLVKESDSLFYIIIEVLKSYNRDSDVQKLIDRNPSLVNASKFLELNLLPNSVPKNVKKNMIKNLNKMDIDEQSKILKIYLYHDADLLFKYGTVSIGAYIQLKTVFSIEEKQILRGILSECHNRDMFTFGNRLIHTLLSKQVTDVVEGIFIKYRTDKITFFNIDTLMSIVSDINSCRKDGLHILCKLIGKGEEMELIILENILEQNNTDIFKPCISEIFSTFLKVPSVECNIDDRHLFENFKKFIKLISSVDENIQTSFIEEFYESISRYPINIGNRGYVKYFIDNLELRELNFGNLKSTEKILTIFDNWESLKSTVLDTESSNNSGSTILTPGGLNDSGNGRKLKPMINNIISKSMKNAKDSYGSSVFLSETISSVDDNGLGNVLTKYTESSEIPSTLPEVRIAPNKDLSQGYLAKSTQLEQKKDEPVKNSSNSVSTIIIEQDAASINRLTETNGKEKKQNANEESEERFTLNGGYLQTKYPKLKLTTKIKRYSDSENDKSGDDEVKLEMNEEELNESDADTNRAPSILHEEKGIEQQIFESEANKKTSNQNNIIDETMNQNSSNIVISPKMSISLKPVNKENSENDSAIKSIDAQEEVINRSLDLMVKLEDPEKITHLIERDEDTTNPILFEDNNDGNLLDDMDKMVGTKNEHNDRVCVDGAVTQEIDSLNPNSVNEMTEKIPKVTKSDTLEHITSLGDKEGTNGNVNSDDDKNSKHKESTDGHVTQGNSTIVQSDVVETITHIPQTQNDGIFEVQEYNGPNMGDDDKSDSDKMPMGIKIPIFNFRKRVSSNIPLNRNSPKRRSLRYATSNTVINVNIPKTTRRPASPEPVIRHPTMNDGFSNDLALSDLSGHDSVNSTVSLRDRLPTKKARKLVSRIRSISTNDLASLSPDERKSMRLEMLDFLMKLEQQSASD